MGLIDSIAHEGGLDSEQYTAEVMVSDNVREALLEAVDAFEIGFEFNFLLNPLF